MDTLEILATIEARLDHEVPAQQYENQAIKLFEAIYRFRPKALARHYVSLLMNMSLIDNTFGHRLLAEQKMRQALVILTPLYQQDPTAFADKMAAIYNNQIENFLAQHQPQQALINAYQALLIYRQLKQRHNMAMALNTVSNIRIQMKHPEMIVDFSLK